MTVPGKKAKSETMKTLLIYENITPVTRKAHGKLSLKKAKTYEFARETNAVPVVLAEFPRVSAEFAIVFTEAAEGVVPAVILGVREKENAYVGKSGNWDASYVPAFIRRYPFVFATDAKAETFTLMIDDNYSGFNQTGKGERLFDADGEHTAFLNNTLNFLREYQAQFARTRTFGGRLAELGLLEPVEARVPLPKDPGRRLTGFKIVNRDKLKALSGDVLASMIKTDELELIYLHLFSLRNLDSLHQKMAAAPLPADAMV
jgi:SapC